MSEIENFINKYIPENFTNFENLLHFKIIYFFWSTGN